MKPPTVIITDTTAAQEYWRRSQKVHALPRSGAVPSAAAPETRRLPRPGGRKRPMTIRAAPK